MLSVYTVVRGMAHCVRVGVVYARARVGHSAHPPISLPHTILRDVLRC